MTKKTTKKEYFTILLNLAEVKSNPELTEFIAKEIDALNRKNANRGKTKTQVANEQLLGTIYENMAENTSYMVKDILQFECCKGLSSQKITPIMRSLFANGLVTNEKIKGTSYYTKVVTK